MYNTLLEESQIPNRKNETHRKKQKYTEETCLFGTKLISTQGVRNDIPNTNNTDRIP